MTGQNWGTSPRRWRAVDGIVLLDKPQGLTSTQALQRVRRHLQAEKAGHAGTLDPMATGMLPLCFGQATKACGTLLGRRKAYSATVRLGVATDTGDAEGQPVAEVDVPGFDADRLEQALAALRGERLQVPPMYSALKRDGRPLYELARQGIEVERAAAPDHDRVAGRDGAGSTGRSTSRWSAPRAPTSGSWPRRSRRASARAPTWSRCGGSGSNRSRPRPWSPWTRSRPRRRRTPIAHPGWRPSIQRFRTCRPWRWTPPRRCTCARGARCRARRTCRIAARYRAYDPAGRFLGLVEPGAAGRLQVERLFVPGAGTNGIGPKT